MKEGSSDHQRCVIVAAVLAVSECSDREDRRVPGRYSVAIHDTVPDEYLVSAALDIFHGNVEVGTLDDFNFEVMDLQGSPLGEQYRAEAESYRFVDHGFVVDKLRDEALIKAKKPNQPPPGMSI